jgi:hypothetical protein
MIYSIVDFFSMSIDKSTNLRFVANFYFYGRFKPENRLLKRGGGRDARE